MANRAKWVVVPIAAGAAALAGERAVARLLGNTIDPTASLSAGGRIAEGAALIGCTEGQRIEVKVTFTQGDVTGEGRTQGDCVGTLASYAVKVVARGPAEFQPGHAEACASAVNSERGKVVDTREWCRQDGVELLDEE
jgi:hypothetical protein